LYLYLDFAEDKKIVYYPSQLNISHITKNPANLPIYEGFRTVFHELYTAGFLNDRQKNTLRTALNIKNADLFDTNKISKSSAVQNLKVRIHSLPTHCCERLFHIHVYIYNLQYALFMCCCNDDALVKKFR
jgi:hypothetical protein